MQPIIDTHVHIWDLQRAAYPWLNADESVLHRNYTLQELEPERLKTRVTAGVLVQAGGNTEDTDLMLEAAAKTKWIKGVVGWLPLLNPAATQQQLETLYRHQPLLKGVRHQVHDEANTQWLLQPAVLESLQMVAAYGLPYDMVGILPGHIETAIQLGEKLPALRLVFDHLNQPPIASKEKFGQWGSLMKTAAQHPNFYAKISGLGTASGHFAGRTTGDIQPYIEFALDAFGPERCFCGGDWPVSLLAESYSGTWQMYETVLGALLNEKQQEKVFYSNAVNFYGLERND